MREELVEYFWDEQEATSYYTYENDRTGELTTVSKLQPLATQEVTEETKASYFANLRFWLQTQPMYD